MRIPPTRRTVARSVLVTFVAAPTASRVAATMLYAVVATGLGLLADRLQHPPAVVTAIIIAAACGTLIANDIELRARA